MMPENSVIPFYRAITAVLFLGTVAGAVPSLAGESVLVPAAFEGSVSWRYTLEPPDGNWIQPDYDDSDWNTGPAGFGMKGTPGAVIGTDWQASDIWLRKTFDYDGSAFEGALLRLHHDEDAVVYLNGQKVLSAEGFTVSYEKTDITAAAKKLLRKGKNALAVTCHQVAGGQFIDVGLVVGPRGGVIPAKTSGKAVAPEVMKTIYEQVKTPFKHGVVIKGEKGNAVDSPSLFRHGDKWYMMYIIFDGRGYETAIAESTDLLHWKTLGKILSFNDTTWDANQAAGYIALQDHDWQGSYELQQHDGKYWLSYIGGDTRGYEAGRLGIGIAWTTEPAAARPWTRLDNNPVLSPDQIDTRNFENHKLYKSHIIRDESNSLGFPYVMFYNARGRYETIGMAVSNDMVTWQRYGEEPVIDNGPSISGDPQVTKIGDVWVMFYFGHGWKPDAFDTFACSYDLVHWTQWEGPHLTEPSEPWDKQFAHKPWVITHDGVVYHFYNAVGTEGRVIALATSKDLKEQQKE